MADALRRIALFLLIMLALFGLEYLWAIWGMY